jgi:hypothetical protein
MSNMEDWKIYVDYMCKMYSTTYKNDVVIIYIYIVCRKTCRRTTLNCKVVRKEL